MSVSAGSSRSSRSAFLRLLIASAALFAGPFVPPAESQVDLTQAHYRWRFDDGGESGVQSYQAAETSTIETTSAVDVPASGMSLTPGAGDYHVWFSSSVEGNTDGTTQFVSLYVNGVKVPHTERQIFTEPSISRTSFPVAFQARLTGLGAAQAIEVRWRTTGGEAAMHSRTLLVTEMVAADSFEATATADTTTSSGSDVLVTGATLTPGAGDYLVWFSGSVECDTGGTTQFVSLYVNGVPVPHTERQILTEGSIPSTSFSVALQARLTGVGAGQAIEARWRTTGGTATMHERNLLVARAPAGGTSEVSATADTNTTSSADVLVSGMSLAAGDGDYNVWFSGSAEGDTGETGHIVSLYVDGTRIDHTERQTDTDGSIPGTSFPVALHARLTGLTAGQSIEVRWRISGGTATMHERTLVIQKSSPPASFAAAEDTKLTGLGIGAPIRLRFGISNEGASASAAVSYRLEWAQTATCSSGSYAPVPTGSGSAWRIFDSPYVDDGEPTTNASPGLTDEAAGFVAGEQKDAGGATSGITLAPDELTELEFTIRATSDALDGADYCFRLFDAAAGQPLDTYSVYAELRLADGTLELLEHGAGQVGDRFANLSSVTDVLLRFRLKRSGTLTVDALRVAFTTASGVANGDVGGGELWLDANGDGLLDGGDTLLQGGVAPVAGVLAFTSDFSPGSGAGSDYLVRAAVSNLSSLDSTTFSLGTADIDEVEPGIAESGSVSYAVHTADCMAPSVYRSIGIDAANLASAGSASIGVGATTVTFSNALPSNVGVGDQLNLAPAGVNEILFILSRDSPTQVTVQTPAANSHSNVAYTIRRAYNALQDWETAREGDLVSLNRREVGVAYDDGAFTAGVILDGSNTDSCRFFWLTVAEGHRHDGTAGTGVVIDGGNTAAGQVRPLESYTVVEWLEIHRVRGGGNTAAVNVRSNDVLLQNLLLHDSDLGIDIAGNGGNSFGLRNSMVYRIDGDGIEGDDFTDVATIENCTIFATGQVDAATEGADEKDSVFFVRNTLSVNNAGGGFDVVRGSQENNISSDGSASCPTCLTGRIGTDNPAPGPGSWVVFDNLTAGSENLHLQVSAENDALDAGKDLSASFWSDLDGQSRLGLDWDVGADEVGATTAVTLSRFEATGGDGEVLVEWQTASELDNLGFHLYRRAAGGELRRLTERIIPGLGSSPAGAAYRFLDEGLENGVTYYYRLEDLDARGGSEFHGPVPATPRAGGIRFSLVAEAGAEATDGSSLITFGEASEHSLRVLERRGDELVVELLTPGFRAWPREDGSVRLEIPGFGAPGEPGVPAIPVKQSWIDVPDGRTVEIAWTKVEGEETVSLPPIAGADGEEIVGSREGTVRAGRRRRTASLPLQREHPKESARLVNVGFQGESRKALLELAPLRMTKGRMVLARRLLVGVSFRGPARDELRARRGRVRRSAGGGSARRIVMRLKTMERGLHQLRYEELFPTARKDFPPSSLRLSRQGEPVRFHLEGGTSPGSFGPGAALYFLSHGGLRNPYGREEVFELELGGGGAPMPVIPARPRGPELASYTLRQDLEENRLYQAALVDAPDLWLWDVLFAPVARSYPFRLTDLVAGEPSRLELRLQGASDLEGDPDHHLRIHVNGSLQTELLWDGKQARRLEIDLDPRVLREGGNELRLENVGDTAASYSMVMLDRFALEHARRAVAANGRLEGRFEHSGTARVEGLAERPHVLDITDGEPRWLTGVEHRPDGVARFRVEAGRSYLAVIPSEVLRPTLIRAAPSSLRLPREGADYLLIGPRDLLAEAEPLVALRRRQGLRSRAVALEEVFDEFGFGETTPHAISAFLEQAYHHWPRPAPRYVLLLGDGVYDYKDFLGTGAANRLPPLLVRTRYLWTASDPRMAAVHGDDLLPDMAIGRLPAADRGELGAMVDKILAYENLSAPLAGLAVLVTDDPDEAGDFVADAEALASGPLAGIPVRKLHLSELGSAAMRDQIRRSFDGGASLLSYIGHGGIHLWADEKLFDIREVDVLSAQERQPLVLTMSCLNGYFHFPYFDSLSEELVKAEGKGAIAAFSPSGLSLNGAAHRFHTSLMEELVRKGHHRLGDAFLAAQSAYARSEGFTELLAIYHLIGDPALRIR